ncbi:MAG: BON domain-containing protein [Pseudomonadales bacterium]
MRGLRRVAGFTALLVAALLAAGCQGYTSDSHRTLGEFLDDASLQSAVKLKLMHDPDIKSLAIDMEVVRGVVYLYGEMPDPARRAHAIEVVQSVPGVARVEDHLKVVTEGNAP